MEAIAQRRSIRAFTDRPVEDTQIRQIIAAGLDAPSPKNRQPWQFVVVRGKKKDAMAGALSEGLLREQAGPLLPGSSRFLKGAHYTASVMGQAPAVVVALHRERRCGEFPGTLEAYFYDAASYQSIGAALQNMSLAAQGMGLGTLWCCDIFFSSPELARFLGTPLQPAAALVVGHPAQSPEKRPRRAMRDVVQWLE